MSRRSGRIRDEQGRRILLKREEEIAHMRRAGQILALTLERLAAAVAPGVTTEELDRMAEATIQSFGATPTFHRLYGFPAHICVSLNDEVVHGIPGSRKLAAGDLVSFDVGVTVEGMIADGAITVGVGELDPEPARLLRATREALARGLAQARAGNRVYDISEAIQRHAEGEGFSVVRKLVGHGVGREMHEPPHVPNFVEGRREDSPELRPGMTLAVEPMIGQGGWQVVQDADGWTYRMRDGGLAAHFEHTIVVGEEGCEVLTARAAPAAVRQDEQARARA